MAVSLDLIETGFDSQTQKTLNRTWSESDHPLRRYGQSKFDISQGVHLRPQFGGRRGRRAIAVYYRLSSVTIGLSLTIRLTIRRNLSSNVCDAQINRGSGGHFGLKF